MSGHLLVWHGAFQILLLFGCTALLLKPMGSYIAHVYNGQFTFMSPILGPVEDLLYKIIGIDEKKEMIWQEYAFSVLSSSFLGFLILFGILRFQSILPLNPENFPNLNNDLAFNIAVSFVTNTNWQAYGGESTLSYFSQMFGLGVQNFLSASMGMAVGIAFIRGIIRKNSPLIGNYWVDLTRGCLYILLPLSIILSILLGSQGVIQNFNHYINAPVLERVSEKSNNILDSRLIPGGPVASQVAIKQLGSNGGGFFNVNSAHPFENPTPISNFLELFAIILIPTALCYTFGIMVGDKRQTWLLLTAMTTIFIPLFTISLLNEQAGNPLISNKYVDQEYSPYQSGGNMEGKELRFGILSSTLWTSVATATSNGSVNSSLDSYTPLGSVVPLMFILLGEIIFGGVGSGLYSILIFVFITVFISGLMIGRTPEYLGKKIQFFEMKMSVLTILIPIIATLFGLAIASLTSAGQAGTFNPGAQGFSELLYAFASSSANNGSSFAGINANTPFYNTILGITMLFGRYWVFITVLAIAGSLAEKNSIPTSPNTLSTHTFFFLILLVGVIMLIGPLTYTPALTLGPVLEYFQLAK